MKRTLSRANNADEIERLSSPYISEGLSQERWVIDEIEISDNQMEARISMTSFYQSDTDDGGFHLSFFTGSQIVSQLLIVYMHLWAGLTEKSREVWMVEFHSRHVRPVRNHEQIKVSIHLEKIRARSSRVFFSVDCRIHDDDGGLFEMSGRGLMS